MLELNGKIPKKGEILNYKNYEFHVEAASISRIIRIKFIINPEPPSE